MTEEEKNEQARKHLDMINISSEKSIINEHVDINEFMIGIPPEKSEQKKRCHD